ncbi:cupin domain-containing protein [Streptomyces sp. NPDC007264]|uniref:cupin domain-containing protein n=1 Tax=Streptomyces sp. NPDC007264 TaxID=3364777 RepID=UPI0036DCB651
MKNPTDPGTADRAAAAKSHDPHDRQENTMPHHDAHDASPVEPTARTESPPTSLDTLIHKHLGQATSSPTGRSIAPLPTGQLGLLTQHLVALRAGSCLPDHENPGDATVLVLRGRVELRTGAASWTGAAGDLLVVPSARHSLEAIEEAAVLLSVVKAR